jgi:DNA-directed RNA polymerase specialized sigma24 family protein
MFEGACPADADDCAAYSMEKLLARWDLPESAPGYVRHPRAYAMTTARRQLQKRRRMQFVALDETEPTLAGNEPALTVFENQQFVTKILEHLSPAQRQVMHLITEGYSPRGDCRDPSQETQ